MQNERRPKNGVSFLLKLCCFLKIGTHWSPNDFCFPNSFFFFFNRFNPVVGGGPNGSVIHYSRNDQKVSLLIVSFCFFLLQKLSIFRDLFLSSFMLTDQWWGPCFDGHRMWTAWLCQWSNTYLATMRKIYSCSRMSSLFNIYFDASSTILVWCKGRQ